MLSSQRIVYEMMNLVGCSESDIKKIYLSRWNGWDGAWCSETVSSASLKAGTTSIVYGDNWSLHMARVYKNEGRFGTNPRSGYPIFFDYGTGISHVGLVKKVTTDKVYTIEGNINGKVVERSYAKTNKYISGYAIPNFEKNTTEITAYQRQVKLDGAEISADGDFGEYSVKAAKKYVLKKGCSHKNTVLWLQYVLGSLYTGTYDGIFGDRTEEAVKKYQTFAKAIGKEIAVDGVAGYYTIKAILEV